MKKKIDSLILGAVLVVALSACAKTENNIVPTPTIAPVETVMPTQEVEPIAQPTVTPTVTPIPEPTATPTPEPTVTPMPEPTATSTLTPKATEIPIPREDKDYMIDYSGTIPAETGLRKLTDTQLKELSGLTPEQAASSIATLADAYAWIAQEGYSTHGASLNWLNNGTKFELENSRRNKKLAWEEMSTVINILLEGDYEEVGTLLCTLVPDEEGWAFFYISFNYVKTDGWYYITDPVCHLENTGYPFCRTYTIKTKTMEKADEILSEINASFNPISIATYPLYTDGIEIWLQKEPISVSIEGVPGLEYILCSETFVVEDNSQLVSSTSTSSPTSFPISWYDYEDVALEYFVDYSGEVPEETGKRKLSDTQLSELSGLTPEQAAKTISTLADAYAWMKQEGYNARGMNRNGDGKGYFRLTNSTSEKMMSWEELSTTLNLLLEDDYEKVGTLFCTLVPDEEGWGFFFISFNYVKQNGWYYITDPMCNISNSNVRAACRTYTIKTNTLKGMKEILADINAVFEPISIVTYPLHTDSIRICFQEEPLSTSFEEVPELKYIFRAEDEDFLQYEAVKKKTREEEMAAWEIVARRIDVNNYQMPSAIGKRTLDYDTAAALVGQEPAVIAENVKSVADAVQYMIAARFGYYSDYFGTPWYNDWGFDAPGDYQISENYGCCCGGYANTASYLLQGDYEKVGTLRWVGGGNHTISWVYTEGKYYVFDFTQYSCVGNYNSYDCPVTVLDRLEDFYDNMPAKYSGYAKSEVVIMVAFEAGDAMYPSHWADPPRFTGLTFPKEAEGKITLIYQKDPEYGIEYKEVDVAIPGWNVP